MPRNQNRQHYKIQACPCIHRGSVPDCSSPAPPRWNLQVPDLWIEGDTCIYNCIMFVFLPLEDTRSTHAELKIGNLAP